MRLQTGRVVDELIELRNLRFHYRDWSGPGPDAPVLVVLHGFTGHARSWDHFAAGMCDRYRVLALDQRGHGESSWAASHAYGYREMVADLEAFVSAMQFERFTLLGLSMGGVIALAYAGQRPTALERLIIVDIGPQVPSAALQKIRDDAARDDVFNSKEAAFALAEYDNPVPPREHHRQRVEANLMRLADGRWTYRYDRALRDPDTMRERLDPGEAWHLITRIDVPSLVLRGADSDVFPADIAQRLVEGISDCEFREIPACGHSIPLDQPEAFLDSVRAFLC